MARQRIGPASPPATVVPFAAPTAKDAPAPRGPHFTDLGAALADVGAERRWLFAGAVEGAPIVVWAGPEKRDKSWAMIDAAVALATGGKWLGAFACERPGPTVYLDGEYGPHEFVRRLARICRGRGVEPAAVIPRVRHYYSRDLSLTNENEAAVWLWQQLKSSGRWRPSSIRGATTFPATRTARPTQSPRSTSARSSATEAAAQSSSSTT